MLYKDETPNYMQSLTVLEKGSEKWITSEELNYIISGVAGTLIIFKINTEPPTFGFSAQCPLCSRRFRYFQRGFS